MKYQKINNNEVVVALDIGTTKICAIAGRLNDYGKLDVVGVGTVANEGVQRGVISNIEKTVKAIREAVRIAEGVSKMTFKKIHVGIAGQHIKSIHHHGVLTRRNYEDEISQKDVDKLIADMHLLNLPAGDKILHIIPQDFTVDAENDIVDPVGMCGRRLEANFHIITGHITASKNIVRCIEKAGLEVADVTLEPIASAAAVLSSEEKEAGVVLVDIGGGTTDITIFKDGIIRHTAVIPFGGDVITSDIIQGCSVLKHQAEKLKVRFGSAMAEEIYDNRIISIAGFQGRDTKDISEKNLALIIQARVEEIFEYVDWEIRRSGYEKSLIAGMVLTGGGSLLKHVVELAEYEIPNMRARLGRPVEHLAHGYIAELESPVYSTAVGLLKNTIDYLVENDLYNNHMEEPEEVHEEEDTQEEVDTTEEAESTGKPINFGKWIKKTAKSFFAAPTDI